MNRVPMDHKICCRSPHRCIIVNDGYDRSVDKAGPFDADIERLPVHRCQRENGVNQRCKIISRFVGGLGFGA